MWTIGIGFAVMEAWGGRHTLNLDGISYLDLADAFAKSDWHHAVNAYWSPLYSALIGAVELGLGTSAKSEFVTIRGLNVAVFVVVLLAFESFLRKLLDYRRIRFAAVAFSAAVLPEWSLVAIGYGTLIWASIAFVGTALVSPDLCVEALFLLAAAVLLRIRTVESTWAVYLLLGMILGLAYLAKAAVFPVAWLLLLASFVWTADHRRAIRKGMMGVLGFSSVSGPLIVQLSLAKNRLTFGESGRLNYAWYVLGNGFQRNWQGGSPGGGIAVHPTRQLSNDPPLFEFAKPVVGSYPVWLDPAYWNEGLRIRFSVTRQAHQLLKNLREFWRSLIPLIVVFLVLGVLVGVTGGLHDWIMEGLSHAALILPSIAALGMYALVHVESRFIAGYVVVIALCVLASIRLGTTHWSGRKLETVTAVCVATLLLPTALAAATPVARAILHPVEVRESEYVARELRRLGLSPGDAIGCIGIGVGGWVRLARVRVIAEIPWGHSPDFWKVGAPTQAHLLDLFREAGARIVLTQDVPANFARDWVQIDSTNFFYKVL